MTTMDLTLEAAEADLDALQAQQRTWTERRAQLAADLDALHAQAGEQALAGTSTTEIAERLARLGTEGQIADRAVQALDTKIQEATRAAQRARIADYQVQAAQLREQAAHLRAEAEPHLVALERIEGVRPALERARSQRLEEQAHRLELGAEELAFRLEHPR